MSALEWNRHAGYPRDIRAGNPPTKSAATPSSISGDNGSTTQHQHGSRFVDDDEKEAAAWCQLRHGDPRQSDETRAAHKGMSDLIDRSWHKGREMGRDEKRLLARYSETLDAADAEMVTAYRDCSKCQGTT